MLTKELSTAKHIAPHFIEPMYASAVRELPDGDALALAPSGPALPAVRA